MTIEEEFAILKKKYDAMVKSCQPIADTVRFDSESIEEHQYEDNYPILIGTGTPYPSKLEHGTDSWNSERIEWRHLKAIAEAARQ